MVRTGIIKGMMIEIGDGGRGLESRTEGGIGTTNIMTG